VKTLPWDMSPQRFDQVLRALRFRYFKWDTHACGTLKILPESIVLTARQHAEIVAIGERLAAVLARLEDRVRRDAGLIAALGIPRELVPMIQAEPPSELQLARYDLFPTVEGGWAVSEFNEDVPGGFNEVIGAPDLLADVHAGYSFPGNFREEFLRAVPADGTVALMYATGYSEDLQHMLVLDSLLRSRGQETVLCSPSHLRAKGGRPAVNGRPIGAAVRFYPGEWFPLLPNLAAWKRLLPGLKMINPLGRLIRQSKRLFALWNLPELLDDDDREFINRLAPETEFLDVGQASRLPNVARSLRDRESASRSDMATVNSASRSAAATFDSASRSAATTFGEHTSASSAQAGRLCYDDRTSEDACATKGESAENLLDRAV
jgi:hypothetical protein